MGYPVDYLDPSADASSSNSDEDDEQERVWKYLEKRKLVATRREDPLNGVISSIKIEAFGRTAAEVEETLLEFSKRCDSAAERPSCAYGECVIERNLNETWGDFYSWKGRLVLHPDIGTVESSKRAQDVRDAEDRVAVERG